MSTQTELQERFELEALPLMQDMFAQAYHLTKNRADAEDLVQETYIRSFRKFGQFKEGTNLKAWMGRILFNQFINNYRKKKRRIKSVYVEGVENMAGVEDQPEIEEEHVFMAPKALAKNEEFLNTLDDDLKAGLEELDERYRDVLLMNTVGELSYREIAKKQKLPIGTVMSRLHRAKAFLRERFGNRMPAAI